MENPFEVDQVDNGPEEVIVQEGQAYLKTNVIREFIIARNVHEWLELRDVREKVYL